MSGILAQGTLIKMGATASPLTAIAAITNFKGPNSSRTVIDATDLSSTAKEKKVGLVDNGEVTLGLNYDLDTHDALDDAWESGALMYFAIVYSSGDSRTFAGYITNRGEEGSIDSLLTAEVTITISGAVARVQAS